MTISFIGATTTPNTTGAVAGQVSTTTSITPGKHASTVAGDLLVTFFGCKPDTTTVTTPAGKTLANSTAGGGGTTGADAGPTRTVSMFRVSTGDANDTEAVTLAGQNVVWTQTLTFRSSIPGVVWDVAGTGGSDSTTGAAWSVTCGNTAGITSGDWVTVGATIPTDLGAGAQFASHGLAATGASFGAITEVGEPRSSANNDIAGYITYAAVTAGTASAAPVITATAGGTTTNIRGTASLVRIREVAPAVEHTGSINLTGDGQLTFSQVIVTIAPDLVVVTEEPQPPSGTLELAGSGSLSMTPVVHPRATVALTGSGALTRTTKPAVTGVRALTGAGQLSLTAMAVSAGTLTLAGDGQLTESGGNLIADPSFESGLNGAIAQGTGTQVFLDSDEQVLTGVNSVKVVPGNVGGGFGIQLIGSSEVPAGVSVDGGEAYTAGLWVWASAGEQLMLTMRFAGSSTSFHSSTFSWAESGWKLLTRTQTAPAGATHLSLKAETTASSTGTAYFVDEAFIIGSPRTALLQTMDLSGSGELSFVGVATMAYGSPLALSGAGALSTAPAALALRGVRALTGSGALSTTQRAGAVAALALSGAGTLAVTTKPTWAAAQTLTGAGQLSLGGLLGPLATSVSLTGSGALGFVTVATTAGSATLALSGSGALSTLSGAMTASGTAALTGSGGLATTRTVGLRAALVLTGSGALSAGTRPAAGSAAALSGSGALSATSAAALLTALALSGSGLLSLAGGGAGAASLNLAGTGQLVAAVAVAGLRGVRALTGSGQLTFARVVGLAGVLALSGEGQLLEPAVVITAVVELLLDGEGQLLTDTSSSLADLLALTGAGQLTLRRRSAVEDYIDVNVEIGPSRVRELATVGPTRVDGAVLASRIDLVAADSRTDLTVGESRIERKS